MVKYRGLEDSNDTLLPDPFIPLSNNDMKLCINVLTSCRPNYLYICLDSIFRNSVFAADNLNTPDVYIYVSPIITGESFTDEVFKVASNFPIRGVFVDDEHKGINKSMWNSFSQGFNLGYDFCLYMEDDWLISTNALKWLYDVPKIAAHYSLYRWQERMDEDSPEIYNQYSHDGKGYTIFKDGRYLSWSIAFQKDTYFFIQQIIKANGIWGLFDHLKSDTDMRRIAYADWDKIIIPILRHYGLLSMAPPHSLLAHFGSKSCQLSGFGQGENRHMEIFSNDKTHWLNNVIQLFNTTSDEEKAALSFRPNNFRYE